MKVKQITIVFEGDDQCDLADFSVISLAGSRSRLDAPHKGKGPCRGGGEYP